MLVKKGEALLYGILTVVAALLLITTNSSPFLIVLLLLYGIMTIHMASYIEENVYIFLFLATFFVFLLGRPIAVEFFGMTKAYVAPMDKKSEQVMYFAMIVSLISLWVGYHFTRKPHSTGIHIIITIGNYTFFSNKSDYFRMSLMKITRPVYMVLGVLQIVENVLRAMYVSQFSYTESYTTYISVFPSALHALVETTPVVFALYLATLPDKKNIRLPWIIYVANAVTFGLCGLRYELISALMLIVLYCFLRNRTDQKKWISRKMIILGCLILPLVIVLLQFMSSWRGGFAVSDEIKSNPIVSFLYAIGGSSNLIAYQDMYHSELTTNRATLYSFGYLVNILRNNVIAQFLGIQSLSFTDRTAQALQGYSFDRAISYYVYTKQYLNGYGAGSCYIAELMCDFSYIGVIFGNVFYGFLLKKLSDISQNHILKNFLVVFMVTLMFRVCRDSFSYPMQEFIGIRNIIMFILLWNAASMLEKRRREYKNYNGEG